MKSLPSRLAAAWLIIVAVLDRHSSRVRANHATIEVDPEFVDGFEDTEAVKVPSPTDLEFTPDGKYLFVTQKEGKVWVVNVDEMDNLGKDKVKPKLAFTVPHPMCNNGARGLLGIGIHPAYPANRWVYLFYNYDMYGDCAALDQWGEGPVNRLSRFTLNDDNTIDPSTEKVFFTTPRLPSQSHNSGDIAFGKDGYLYITVGDAGTRSMKNDDGIYFPQALDRLMGKVVRLTDTGDIPPDNPYTPQMGELKSERCNEYGMTSRPDVKCQEIYATGLRNPYRFAMDPNTPSGKTRYYINEVGRQQWERILPGGDDYSGANYGYPFRQGPCEAGTKIGEYEGCGPSEFVDPVHWYEHDPEDGGACTGGAFVPDTAGWPESFKGSYLYAEYAYGGIYRISPGGQGCPYPECDPPVSDYMTTKKTFSATKKVVSMHFGPHRGGTALYYLTRGDTGNRGVAGIFRIAYTGSSNRAPKPHIVALSATVGFAPLTVQFDGATESVDPDYGDTETLTYYWDFDGDGITDSNDPKAEFVYDKPGTYMAKLTVRDARGGSASTTLRIDADNTPPVPKIISPAEGTTFAVGDVLRLVGSATDAEDGDELDDGIRLTWEVRQHHNTHYHPFLDPTEGNDFDLWPAPPPEDFDASLTSYLNVLLTATDSTGLSTTTSVIVRPRTVDIVLDSAPVSGLHVVANGDKFRTPATITTWENHRFDIEAPTTQTTNKGGTTYGFKKWSDGKRKPTRPYVVPAQNPDEPLVANFVEKAAGPEPPLIMRPARGTTFAVDDRLKLQGFATDATGTELPDSSLTWEIRYRSTTSSDDFDEDDEKHKQYYLLEPTRGNNIEIKDKLVPRDLKTAGQGYLEIVLTATDASGASKTTSLALKPRTVEVEFDTVPSGLELMLNMETFRTPVTVTTWENHAFNVRAKHQMVDGSGYYKFAKWSDGGKRSHKYRASSSSSSSSEKKDRVTADFELALPVPEIVGIDKGSTFAVGDGIELVGYATDIEGEPLPADALTWEVRFYFGAPQDDDDSDYRTILEPTRGNGIELDAPGPANFDEAETSYLKVLLTSTDGSTGLSSTRSLVLEPSRVNLFFDTEPSGFYVTAGGQQIYTPATVTTWDNHRFEIEVPAQAKGGVAYYWNRWSDGGAASHEYVARARAAGRRNKPRVIKAVLGQQRPAEEPAKLQITSPMIIEILPGAAVAAFLIIVLCVLILLWRRKKKGITIVDIYGDDKSVHDGHDMKYEGQEVVLRDAADDSTLGDNDDSQDDIEASDNGSSSSSVGAASTPSALVHTSPRHLLSYLPSSSSSIRDGGESRPYDEDSSLSPSLILGTDQACDQSLSGDTVASGIARGDSLPIDSRCYEF